MGNIAIFIPARLSSTRLPSKALLSLHGKPALQNLIERIKRCKEPDSVILCTTTKPEDDKLVDLARRMDIKYFRGSEHDILERYAQAAAKFGVTHIVNVDGDDIFCDPLLVDITAKELLKSHAEFIIWKNLPLGTTPVGINVKALQKVCSLKESENTETGWGRFFTETGLFEVKHLYSDDVELNDTNIRLTLDYPEDLELFNKIYGRLKEPFFLKDIVKLLHDNPELLKINEKVKDVYKQNFENKAAQLKMKSNKL